MPIFTNTKENREPLKYITIGDGVTKNLTIYEYKDDIIAVDYGIGFPEGDDYGVDFIIPDMTYLTQNAHRVKGLFISHAHADHFGAVPYLLKEMDIPIYANKLTQEYIKEMLEEKAFKSLKDSVKYHLFDETVGEVNLGAFKVSAFKVNHSVPGSLGIKINTPEGVILHMADYKIDKTPVIDTPMDLEQVKMIGDEGVLCLVSDSLGSRSKGAVDSEASLNNIFHELFEKYEHNQVFVTVISSNISRMHQIIEAAMKLGKKVVPMGRSMDTSMQIARNLGYLPFPDDVFVDIKKAEDYSQEALIYVIAGCFGQRGSSLDRLSRGEHSDVTLNENAIVIFSAEPNPPGVDEDVDRVCSDLILLGAEVIDHRDYHLHVSGHGHQEELLTVAKLVRSKYFIPMGGNPFHLHSYSNLIHKELGISQNNIFELQEGEILEFTNGNVKKGTRIEVTDMFYDGIGLNPVVIADRVTLSTDGVFVVVVPIKRETKEVGKVDVITRGFVYVKESKALLGQSRDVINKILDKSDDVAEEWGSIKNKIEKDIQKYLFKETRRKPLVIVHSIFL